MVLATRPDRVSIRKSKAPEEKRDLSLDLRTLEYQYSQSQSQVRDAGLTKSIDNLRDRIPVLLKGTDKAGEFHRRSFASLFQYISYRIPEVSDEIYRIDRAVAAGFGWEMGPLPSGNCSVKAFTDVMKSLGQCARRPGWRNSSPPGMRLFIAMRPAVVNVTMSLRNLPPGRRRSRPGSARCAPLNLV